MRWAYETSTEKIKRLSVWHTYFAWHPIWQRGKAVWLVKVKRRATILQLPYGQTEMHWEYDL